MHCRNLFSLFWLLVSECDMKVEEKSIEWDVELWCYVLYYNGVRYSLDVTSAPEAYTRAELKLHYLKRLEPETVNGGE